MAGRFVSRLGRFASFRRTVRDENGVVKVAPRREPGKMNQNEERYAEYLNSLPEVREWHYEAIKLRLADATFIEIDFAVFFSDNTMELHGVKDRWGAMVRKMNAGKVHIEDDAQVKLKWLREKYPFRIRVMSFNKLTGMWEEHAF